MPTDRFLPLVVALLVTASHPALAQQEAGTTGNDFTLSCSFVQECYETEPCADTDFALSVEGRVGGLGAGVMLARATLSSVSGDVDTFGTRGAGALFLQGGDGAVRHYLAVAGSAARYTVHLAAGPASVSYFGTCE
ncbi:hypothetical protein [Rhodovulum marinum]|uniref:Uncharacterized protein n=1 Tax=Rhodovulum marinum TaxID=320662 RepID=A0A4R2PY70_9RHOB|nr:hypothetical protein [Rhodovulum marinum]TCP40969.1 hypothetical protein EV662_106186 [Rhodovulum marinum]